MTIELITGTPGAGKTCFAVAKRVVPEYGTPVAYEDSFGNAQQATRRVVVGGIRGLVCEHERLPHTLTGERVTEQDREYWNRCDADDEPIFKRLPAEPPVAEVLDPQTGQMVPVVASIFNWWLWCKPGDLIVFDEVQFVVPRGTLGKKPPHYIKSLEIHRHYGVDFIFITQSPTLLDSTIRGLVGRHLHVRSVFGTSLCMLYEWDHASNTERYSNANKSKFIRRAKYFSLYKSTVAVLKPPSNGRRNLLMIPVVFLVAAFFVNRSLATFHRGDQAAPVAAVAASAGTGGSVKKAGQLLEQTAPHRRAGWLDVPKLAGCFTHGDQCGCIAEGGRRVRVEPAMCRLSASSYDGLVDWEPRREQPAVPSYGASAAANGQAGGVPAVSSLGAS